MGSHASLAASTATFQPWRVAWSRKADHAVGPLVGGPDGVGRDEAHAVAHGVGDERVADAEVVLVVAQGEVGERVAAVCGRARARAASSEISAPGSAVEHRPHEQPTERHRQPDADGGQRDGERRVEPAADGDGGQAHQPLADRAGGARPRPCGGGRPARRACRPRWSTAPAASSVPRPGRTDSRSVGARKWRRVTTRKATRADAEDRLLDVEALEDVGPGGQAEQHDGGAAHAQRWPRRTPRASCRRAMPVTAVRAVAVSCRAEAGSCSTWPGPGGAGGTAG